MRLYRWKPKDSAGQARACVEAAREYTACIALAADPRATWELSEWENQRPLPSLIGQRARLYRMGAEMRARLARKRA